MQKIYIEQVFT